MFRAPSPFQRRLAVESLESRRQMAGMVELALDGGNWTFTGDAAANGIEIEFVTQGEYFVRGTQQGGQATQNQDRRLRKPRGDRVPRLQRADESDGEP